MKSQSRLKAVGALVATAALLLWGGPAMAAPNGGTALMCTGGDIASGTYSSITVTGHCTVTEDATISVTGNITVAAGAILEADGAPSTITVGHNVTAGPGAWIALGCTLAHGGCSTLKADVLVKGNVTLDHVFNAALNGITVNGNVTSMGGGAGLDFPGFIPFSVKDDIIGGNLTVSGLTTTWFGVIRTSVGRNVTLTSIKVSDPDGNEIVHDVIGRNLTCTAMNVPPQFGDATEESSDPAYPYSTVGGHANGQCGFVLAP